ncbi:Retrovirus-related Pol polyprotein from transposon TNT 1-94 [Senna tora]|uniref:Retrovirus-related Pol polyprotein from transposon TNT 1-94 n=1 Tax=Senna tora TaxID=362788 RepID=A0A834SZY8_9FABA|nr:Retrovirus-related Pol polyprotein from transposon TNT 1-94 [Senna tora]
MITGLSAALNGIPVLNGTNFKNWKERVMIVLGCLDLDNAFRLDRPAALTDGNSNVSYNTQKEKWSLNELIAQCVQEEERHKQNKVESAHLASSSSVKASNKRKRNEKGTADKGKSSQNVQKKQDTGPTCFFCRKHGHVKKDCSKFSAW